MKRKEKLNLMNILICILISILSVSYYNYFIDKKFNDYNFKIENSKILLNKIIIVGDSRIELINDKKEQMNIPDSVIFIARSGATIEWLYNTGLPELKEILNNRNSYKYHVVFNLGVNDINYVSDVKERAKLYYDIYDKVIDVNEDVSFYFLSVNPVDENRIYEYFSMDNKRTNRKIEKFNNYFINRLDKENTKNATYCDSYNDLDFYLPDGLHYDTPTDTKIIKYIIENCINY